MYVLGFASNKRERERQPMILLVREREGFSARERTGWGAVG
uniref:Uncharacterized protein n=1 Tax=Nelumbo nucifera TaxID=4432 RepID=A0A822XP29_NELNU|nr:TPA_asm: hypothetical protein HUJ06_023633 [Nelumbo nucifera]